jgi:hypothetical protein
MADSITFTIDKGSEWESVISALARVDHELPGELRRRIRRAVDPLVAAAQAKVESMPTRGHGHTGLRAEVGSGVNTVEIGFGKDYLIRVTTSMDESDEVNIPLGMDRMSGWRHPVFGHEDRWVQQYAMEPGWFSNTFANAHDSIESALEDALEWARDVIASAG